MLYPVLPVNYYIGPLSYSNLCSIIIVTIYLLVVKEKKIINIFKYIPFFWVYLIIYAIFAFCTTSYLVGIAWIFSTILVSLVLIDIIRTEEYFLKVINAIIISSVALSIIGIFEAFTHIYLIQGNLLDVFENMRYGILRATGPFGICINYGLYQAISAILIFYKKEDNKLKGRKNRKLNIAYILVVFSLFLSVSRLAICLFVATQAILYLQMGLKKALRNICVAIVIMSLMIIILDTIGFSIFDLISDFGVSFGELIGIEIESTTKDRIDFGNRTDLYEWVINDMKDNKVLGKGLKAEFSHKLASWYTKTSIEVHYLYILYHCGYVGLIFLILSYLSTIKYFFKNRNIIEQRNSFNKVLLVIFIIYYICLFGIQETDLTRFYCELIALGIAYTRISKNRIGERNENNI